jgi:hypothetical protein
MWPAVPAHLPGAPAGDPFFRARMRKRSLPCDSPARRFGLTRQPLEAIQKRLGELGAEQGTGPQLSHEESRPSMGHPKVERFRLGGLNLEPDSAGRLPERSRENPVSSLGVERQSSSRPAAAINRPLLPKATSMDESSRPSTWVATSTRSPLAWAIRARLRHPHVAWVYPMKRKSFCIGIIDFNAIINYDDIVQTGEAQYP